MRCGFALNRGRRAATGLLTQRSPTCSSHGWKRCERTGAIFEYGIPSIRAKLAMEAGAQHTSSATLIASAKPQRTSAES